MIHMKAFKKVVLVFFLMPFIISILIIVIFIFMLVDGTGSSNDNTVFGLPTCIKEEMVVASLQCQEKYHHPASVTLAQIIQESSGKYDGLSGLAYNYHNLFGLKAGTTWMGKTCSLSTTEQDENGNIYQ